MNPHEKHEETTGAERREALLTAYALGETDDAQTREVEALLAQDAAAAAQVEEIRAAAALLTDGFAAESGEHLPVEAREAVTAAAAGPAAVSAGTGPGRVRRLWPLVGMAASIGFGAGLAAWFGAPPRGDAVEAARAIDPLARQRDAQRSDRDGALSAAGAAHAARVGAEEKLNVLQNSNDAVVAHDDELEKQLGTLVGTQQDLQTKNAELQGEIEKLRDELARTQGRAPIDPPAPVQPTGPQTPGVTGPTVQREAGGGGGHATGGGDGAGTGGTVHVFGREGGGYENGGGGGGGGARLVAGGEIVTPGGEAGGPTAPGGKFTPTGAGGRLEDVDGLNRVREAGGRYGGPGGEVAPDSREPSDPAPEMIGILGEGGAVPGATGGRNGVERTVLRVEVERLQQQMQDALEATKIDLPAASPRLPDVQVVRRFLEVREDLDGQEVAAALDAYNRVLAEARRVKAERFRDRHGLTYGIPGSEDYAHPGESTFRDPADEPLSTFSIDVDTASYANVRRFLNNGQLPPPAAVRIEEMVNYFTYSDPLPQGEHPIAATLETATCPWNTRNRLVRVGIKAKTFDEPPPPANLVFLIDVSGSMRPADKLPLLQQAMKMLADQMREGDRVAIVTYASNSGVRLQSTDGSQKDTIKGCIEGLSAGGSTNGGSGIIDAYRIAQENFVEGGINRVILATDGDFNVGVTDRGELTRLIEEKAKSGVFLSVLGVGTGNLKDATLESLADRGNGNYHYLDGLREARKVLVDDLMGTVITVAKDVKIQIEFNPVTVGAYRLVGYENRMLAAADFNDDTKDAGEMGAGHTVTALFEIVPAGGSPQEGVDPLRYQKSPPAEVTDAARSGEMLTLKVRYKLPEASTSTKFEMPLTDSGAKFDAASEDLRFASAVASFGMLLRGSPAAAGTSYDAVLELAQGAIGEDPGGHRAQMLDLVLKAKKLSGR